MRRSSREASSVSTVCPDAEMSAPLVRIWWISQPPHPIAKLTTASCNAKPSADEVSAATKPSSNSRHKSTKSIHDTTWAARGTLVACTRPAKRPARRPVSRFSSDSTVAALMGKPCHAIASMTSTWSHGHCLRVQSDAEKVLSQPVQDVLHDRFSLRELFRTQQLSEIGFELLILRELRLQLADEFLDHSHAVRQGSRIPKFPRMQSVHERDSPRRTLRSNCGEYQMKVLYRTKSAASVLHVQFLSLVSVKDSRPNGNRW